MKNLHIYLVSVIIFLVSFVSNIGVAENITIHGRAESWMGPDGIPRVSCTGGYPNICMIIITSSADNHNVILDGRKLVCKDIQEISNSNESEIQIVTFKLLTK